MILLKDIQYIIIHHTASSFRAKVADLKAGCLRWLDSDSKAILTAQGYVADYHCFVDQYGGIEMGQPRRYWTANCGIDYINEHSLAIACIGNLQEYTMPEKMLLSLANEVKYWMNTYGVPIEKVMLHRDIVSTDCPGKQFRENEFRRLLMGEMISPPFKDVTDSTRYSYESICLMKQLGWMKGNEKGYFKPKDPISREDMACLLKNLRDKKVL